MISYSELEKGIKIILEGQPHEIIEGAPLFKGRGHSVFQAKLKNLKTGNVISRTFHSSDTFKEAKISKIEAKFLYTYRNRYFFSEARNSSKRFDLTAVEIGEQRKFLKPNQIVKALVFENKPPHQKFGSGGKVINILLPIKINLKVIEAPPGVKAGRAEAGNKQVTLETETKINVPLFIKEGDIIEINTKTGEYIRRIEKK